MFTRGVNKIIFKIIRTDSGSRRRKNQRCKKTFFTFFTFFFIQGTFFTFLTFFILPTFFYF